ncbi:MAG: matrixin family metalloprotease [Verrucomicrobiota bacterium]|nr:matrixin family metalloprotease [Verrucomicrobiota bacterium]
MSRLSRLKPLFSPAALLVAAVSLLFTPLHSARAYVLNGKTWASGEIVLRFGLGNSALPMLDGNSSWDAALAPVLDVWNSKVARIHLSSVVVSPGAATSGDRLNSVVFAPTVFGQSFGSGTLAVTYYIMQGTSMVEADVLFNTAQTFNSYRGELRFGGNGFALADIRRVFLHELGHAIGLNHADGDNIMAPMISNREVLSPDDIAGAQAMYGAPIAPIPAPAPAPATSHLANISTRLRVGLNDDAMIGGFIVRGTTAKKLILRAIGPSIAQAIAGALTDPTLELYDGAGRLLAQNDNWQSGTQVAEIVATGVAPTNPLESAIVATLQPGSYTAVVRGANGAQGIGLVEAYELDSNATRLVNLSTRGRVGADQQAMIGGLIVTGTTSKKLIVRGIGPSVASIIPGALTDPTLEIRDGSGQLVGSNDNWGSSAQRQEIIDSTVAPSNPLESAVVATLAPGSYTAIVRGVNNGTGVGLIEVYDLEP